MLRFFIQKKIGIRRLDPFRRFLQATNKKQHLIQDEASQKDTPRYSKTALNVTYLIQLISFFG